jgi:hypothetical protein
LRLKGLHDNCQFEVLAGGRKKREQWCPGEKPPEDEEAIFFCDNALCLRGRKQEKYCPQLGGQHLHDLMEGLRNLMMGEVSLNY